MTNPETIAQSFFAGLSAGNLGDDIVTEDLKAWSITTRQWAPGDRYRGAIPLLAKCFDGGCDYRILSLTAQDDRIAAEVNGTGTLTDGQSYDNDYLFLLRVRDGRVCEIKEYFDASPVINQLGPKLGALMGKNG